MMLRRHHYSDAQSERVKTVLKDLDFSIII